MVFHRRCRDEETPGEKGLVILQGDGPVGGKVTGVLEAVGEGQAPSPTAGEPFLPSDETLSSPGPLYCKVKIRIHGETAMKRSAFPGPQVLCGQGHV